MELILLYTQAPPPLTDQCRQVCIVSATAFASSKEEAARALSPVAACPVGDCLVKDLNAATPFDALFDIIDRAFPAGRRYAADMLWLRGEPTAVLTRAAAEFEAAPSPESLILAGVLAPPPPGAPGLPDAAFSMVAPMFLGCYSVWSDPAEDARNAQWLADTTRALSQHTVGYYVGETDLTADAWRAARSFAPPNWERLQALKARYDPDNVFHSYLTP